MKVPQASCSSYFNDIKNLVSFKYCTLGIYTSGTVDDGKGCGESLLSEQSLTEYTTAD